VKALGRHRLGLFVALHLDGRRVAFVSPVVVTRRGKNGQIPDYPG